MRYLLKGPTIVVALSLFAGLNVTMFAQVTSDSTNTIRKAKEYRLSGKVTDNLSQPISGAKVTVVSRAEPAQPKTTAAATAKTNANGKFKTGNIPAGKYTIKIEADGYQTSKQQVAITKDKSIAVKLELSQP